MGEKGQASANPMAGAVGAVGSNAPQAQGLGGTISAAVGNIGGGSQQGAGDISGLMSQVASADPSAAAAATAAANAQGAGEKGQAGGNVSDLSSQQQLRLQQEQDALSKAGQMASNAAKEAGDAAGAITGNMK